MPRKELKYEIVNEFGIVGRKEDGSLLRLRQIRWGDNPIKYDLRWWGPTGDAHKGITFGEEELENLKEVLGTI